MAIERDIAGKHQEIPTLWLEGMNDTARPDQIGECDSMGADIGAGVDDNVAELDKLAHQLDLEIAPLAVKIEAATNKCIIAVVHEQAMLAALDRHVPVFDEIRRLHLFLCSRCRSGKRGRGTD